MKTNNNPCVVAGIVVGLPAQSKEKSKMEIIVATARISGFVDYVRVVYRIGLNSEKIKPDTQVYVSGQWESYNVKGDDGKYHLVSHLQADELEVLDDCCFYNNYVDVIGYVHKTPRASNNNKLGRKLTILNITNDGAHKTNYIPVLAWGDDADVAMGLNVGDKVVIKGRIQTRTYYKGNSQIVIAEVSADELEVEQ